MIPLYTAEVTPTQRAHALRFLSVDAVEKARSGHPGAPLGLADVVEVLWHRFLKHHPEQPLWPDRDRFVLSNGHASMLLYSVLHLTGYPISRADLQAFRQWGSVTPGHPEHDLERGIETTTGPLGQGFANAVGMALAEKILAARYNQPDLALFDHHTYVIVGDGCLMEGVCHEAAALAGTWGLEKLVVIWDNNGISIDGPIRGWCTEDVPARFRAYGFSVITDVDGHDPESVASALEQARTHKTGKPYFIACKTHIGYGAPHQQDQASAHGSPLGSEETAALREALGWPYPPFEIPESIVRSWDARPAGQIAYADWMARWEMYQANYPEAASTLRRLWAGERPPALEAALSAVIHTWISHPVALASRQASAQVLAAIGPHMPELIGGSADLTASNGTHWPGAGVYQADTPDAQYIQYGVREFGMTAIMNGLALHGEWIPYGGTFLTFADYARNAVRMAALMELPIIAVYTHDSIGVGEDGPTHQPVEHLAMLRMTPNLWVWRPMDAVETAVAWKSALISGEKGPTVLALSRQTLPAVTCQRNVEDMARGAYILWEPEGVSAQDLDALIIATGSEVHVAWAAACAMVPKWRVRVVSMPCAERFAHMPIAYQEHVIPPGIRARVAVEAGATAYWYRWVGLEGRVVGIDTFGASAPAAAIYQAMGITPAHIQHAVEDSIQAVSRCRVVQQVQKEGQR